MNLARIHASLLLLICSYFCLRGAQLFAQPDMSLYNSFNDRYLDDPNQAIKDAREQFSQLSSSRNPDQWLQVLLFLSRNDWGGPWAGQHRDRFMETALKLADGRQYRDLALMLEYDQAETRARKKHDYQAVKDNFRLYIEKSEERQLPLSKAWLTTAFAYSEYENGDSASALQWGKVSLETILKVRSPQDADTLTIKNTLAVILESMGNKTQTIEVYEDLELWLRAKQLRFSLAIVLCNHGLLLVHNRLDMVRAGALYKEALGIADNLQNSYLQTLSHKGVADVLLNQEQKDEALLHLNQGLETSKTWPATDILRSGLFITKSKVLVEMKRWQEALDAAASGENETTNKDKNTLRTIRYVMARSYAGLSQYQKAFIAQKEAFELLEAIHNEEREKETNKLHIQLGLELQEQKSTALKNENDLQRKAAVIVLSLACLIIALLGFALRKAGEVKRSRERMQRILNNIEEGILTIGKGMRVESSLSPYLYTLLRLDPAESAADIFRLFMAAVDLDEDEKSTLRSVLETCLGENRSTWEFNLGQLPAELSLSGGKQWLGLHWQALFNEQGQVQSILMAVRDSTETRRLRQANQIAEQQRADTERHLQELLLLDPREARSFVKEFTATLLFLDRHLLAQEKLPECLRALHTSKGLARTLGLKELSLLVHDMEEHIHAPALLAPLQQRFRQIFADYEIWVNRLYPESTGPRATASPTLHEQLGRLIPSVQKQLIGAGMQLAAFRIDDAVLEWDLNLLEKMGAMLMHGLTNSVDHGFILPKKRGQNPARPEFFVEAMVQGLDYRIRLFDNGAGLNIAALQQKARELGLADWNAVLFQDGFSTAEQVSTTSGRGVGLAAIRQLAQELGGGVSLKPNDKRSGTCLDIQIPVPNPQSYGLRSKGSQAI